jgi:hypothetical protein
LLADVAIGHSAVQRLTSALRAIAEEEFDHLCFEYGIELDDVVSRVLEGPVLPYPFLFTPQASAALGAFAVAAIRSDNAKNTQATLA